MFHLVRLFGSCRSSEIHLLISFVRCDNERNVNLLYRKVLYGICLKIYFHHTVYKHYKCFMIRIRMHIKLKSMFFRLISLKIDLFIRKTFSNQFISYRRLTLLCHNIHQVRAGDYLGASFMSRFAFISPVSLD